LTSGSRGTIGPRLAGALLFVLMQPGGNAHGQQLDLTHGGPVDITATDGIEWRQTDQQVIARGNARAIRGAVTVTADRLIAWYRKKGTNGAPQPTPAPAGLAADPSTEGSEIYRLQAEGHVRIFTQTDLAQGDRATYDLDQAVLVMTGRNLKLTTPNDVLTARDDLEYWPQKHMAVARGDAVVVTNDAKRIAADTLVAYTEDTQAAVPGRTATSATTTGKPAAVGTTTKVTPAAAHADAKPTDDPLASSGKLQRVEAFGHVSVRTPTDTVTGDRAVYVPDTGMARVGGNVQITRGQNQLNGAEADVNMKTGIAKLLAANTGRVHGLVLPNDETSKSLSSDPAVAPNGASSPAKSPGTSGRAGAAATSGPNTAPAAVSPSGVKP
jgi:lipopolysaccharide export system protein LptA